MNYNLEKCTPMKLTNTAIINAKAKDKTYKLFDGGGMYLSVQPNGSKYWRLKYRFNNKEGILALGTHPEVSLKKARIKRDEARKQLSQGINPAVAKKEEKNQAIFNAKNSFEMVAREWMDVKKTLWTPRYAKKVRQSLENNTFPKLGKVAIADITAPVLLEVLRDMEKRGIMDMAQRCLQYCRQIFMYGIVTSRIDRNPAADLKGALKRPVKSHYLYLSEEELPAFLKKAEQYKGSLQVKLALKFLILTIARTVEVRAARWEEIDWDKKEWNIPAVRMKMRKPHVVPLSTQAMKVLEELKELTGYTDFLFPNHQNPVKFMSENAILYAIYAMGYRNKTTSHGFRHTISTLLNEKGFRSDIIEASLAHGDKDKIRGTYNHATYSEERRHMMQWWGDCVDALIYE